MRAATTLTVLLLVLGLAACGGGGDSTSTSVGTTARGEATSGGARGSGKGKEAGSADRSGSSSQVSRGSGKGGEGSARGAHRVNAAPLKVSGGGSAQFKAKGGDNSVQEYGAEAGESELQEVAERVHSFYVAHVAGEWQRACSYLAKSTIEGFEELAASSPKLEGEGCPAVLAALTKPVPPSLQRQLTSVDAAALRSEGERGFLIYTGPPGKTVYAMPLNEEGGEWKLGALSASALPAAK